MCGEPIAVFSCVMGRYQDDGKRLFPQRQTLKEYGAMDTNSNLCKRQGGIRKKSFATGIGQSLGWGPEKSEYPSLDMLVSQPNKVLSNLI